MSSSKRCGAIGMWPGSDKAKNDHRPETLGLLGQGRISNAESRIGGHNTHFPSCFYFGDTKYAQFPAILLDIKSPATASLFNEIG